MSSVTDIFRHPIKAHGVERLEHVMLEAGQTMPWDRAWAVAYAGSQASESEWSKCGHFTRAATCPGVHAITAKLDEATGAVTLSHPDHKDLTFQPDDAAQHSGFFAWVRPLVAGNRPTSDKIVKIPGRGMTDTDFPSISLNNQVSLRALSQHMGQDLAMARFRGNIWVDGLAPFEEHDWVGKTIRIGGAVFKGIEPIGRCKATHANPATGKRDADTLDALERYYGHTDFGLFMEVVEPGSVSLGDALEIA